MSLLPTGILTALLAGTLDTLAAAFILSGGKLMVFQYIVASVHGRETAFAGGSPTILMGLVFHYFIAGCFTLFFFTLYPRLYFLQKNAGAVAVLYGIFIYTLMNRIIVPLTRIHPAAFSIIGATKNAAIIVVCVAFLL